MNTENSIFENTNLKWKGEEIVVAVRQSPVDGALYVRLSELPEPLQLAFNLWCILGSPCHIQVENEEGECVQSGDIHRFIHEEESYPRSANVQNTNDKVSYVLTKSQTKSLQETAEKAHLQFIKLNKTNSDL